ncbi:DUF1998 [Desulfonema magnum]|uniref:DUF1998 n=2 Tax=Desulfonema magnum TaxID=45655 RepID=A0A975BXL7_9BACT|nr:DUF1998 [Desulfonema magnum]
MIKLGDLRPSQLLYTFGIGSLIDLPNMSVLVMGLDDWDTSRCQPVTEERLLAALRLRLGSQLQKLSMPPFDPDAKDHDNPFGPQIGVPVVPFPRWLRCSRCNHISTVDSGLFKLKSVPYYPDRTRYVHINCNKAKEPPALPVRFVVACKNGHLHDFPWTDYVHRGQRCSEKTSVLILKEVGVSGEASDIIVKCESCGMERRMGDALGPGGSDVLPSCKAWHPHLRTRDKDGCSEPLRVTLLGASNAWFPITLSAISIPNSATRLIQILHDNWATLEPVTSLDILRAFRQTPFFSFLTEFSDEEIWDAIVKKRASEDQADTRDNEEESLKIPEWEVFSNPEGSPVTDDFKLRAVAPPAGYEKFIEKTVLVERIREVRAIMNFTRIESPGDFMDGDEIPEERLAPLSRKDPTWLPAAEVHGEGLFLHFKESAIREWYEKRAVKKRNQLFFTGHIGWRKMRKIEPNDHGFPSLRYVMLHSFAHGLMRQLSIECGYTAASIRERIYSRYSEDPEELSMAGILIYTAASDSEGTLGGLVNLGDPETLGRHIDQALEQIRVCASDPLCAEHLPTENTTGIHGAACHACLFAPETSCERGNKYLDRATLVETFSMQGTAFFE